MTKPLRVLHVISVFSVGGVEVWLTALLRYIAGLDHASERESFDILLTGGRKAELDELAASLGATLHYVPFGRRSFLQFAAKLRQLLEERDYAAIHDHQDYAAAWHFLAGGGRLPKIRIVHVHNSPARLRAATGTPLRKALFVVSRRLVRRFATHVLGTSARILHEYQFDASHFPRQVIRTLHCGFDVAPFGANANSANADVCAELGWPAGSRIALFVGRLDGHDPTDPGWNGKNPQFALDVAREALARGCDMRLVMVGGGEEARRELERSVIAWGLGDRIRLVGRRLDVARFMTAAHCFIFPSLEEGLGMVAVEAQAAGLRVLASDTIPREAAVVPEMVSFLSLDAGVEAWAAELTRLLSLPRFDTAAANEAVGRSAFSIAKSYEALHKIYRSGSA